MIGIADWRHAGEVRTYNGDGLPFFYAGQIRNGVGERWRKLLLCVTQANHRLIQRKCRDRCGIELLSRMVVSDYNNLRVRTEEMYRSNAVGSSEDADLFGESGEHLKGFLRLLTITGVIGVAMHP